MLTRERTLFKGNRHHISNLFLSGFGKKKRTYTHTHTAQTHTHTAQTHTHTAQNGGAKRSDVNSNLR